MGRASTISLRGQVRVSQVQGVRLCKGPHRALAAP